LKPLNQYKVIVCAGTGGVGKTTIAAALGELFARQGRRALVLTIDPARRLASALGMSGQAEEFRAPLQASGELWAAMIDSSVIFDRFVRRASATPEQAQRLLRNRLYQELSRSLNGSQEFTALERLLEAEESGRYDVVILDTPPSQHAIDFLRAPERIFALFQESITKWFVQAESQNGFLQSLFHRGTKTVLSALERITGSQFIGELSDFFANMSVLQKEVAERSIRVHRLLTHADTGFVLVTGFDEAKLKESKIFAHHLRRTGHQLAAVVINRTFPEWASQPHRENSTSLQKLNEYYDLLARYFAGRIELCDQFAREWHPQSQVIKIPDFYQPVCGLDGLHLISLKLEAAMASERGQG
jgi:anion-transporting  ArsA/GET3 family ATPase